MNRPTEEQVMAWLRQEAEKKGTLAHYTFHIQPYRGEGDTAVKPMIARSLAEAVLHFFTPREIMEVVEWLLEALDESDFGDDCDYRDPFHLVREQLLNTMKECDRDSYSSSPHIIHHELTEKEMDLFRSYFAPQAKYAGKRK